MALDGLWRVDTYNSNGGLPSVVWRECERIKVKIVDEKSIWITFHDFYVRREGEGGRWWCEISQNCSKEKTFKMLFTCFSQLLIGASLCWTLLCCSWKVPTKNDKLRQHTDSPPRSWMDMKIPLNINKSTVMRKIRSKLTILLIRAWRGHGYGRRKERKKKTFQ